MKIVITGAAGLVGRRLVPALAGSHQVCAVSRRAAGSAHAGVEWIQADLTSADLARTLPAAADVVIHLAQSPRHAEFPEGAADMFAVNVGSTAHLLDWARSSGVRQFIVASSGAVVLPGHERSFYAVSKQSAEMLAACYADLFGVLVFRFFFIYGAGQRRSMLVPRLVDAVRTNSEVRLAGTNGPRLNPVHVDDVVAAIACAVERNVTGTINVAGPDVLSVRQMTETIARLMDCAPRFAADDQTAAADLSGDITAMRERLVPPRRRFEQGVTDVIAALGSEG